MSAETPRRPDIDDDLDQAYARAHALADGEGGPSASVRANVLAAARDVEAQAKARIAAGHGSAPPLTPVAPPVAAVGGERSMAVNLSSWRVRSGAAVCAALFVALGVWRFDASRRVDGGVQVATATLELAPPPARTLARDLPPPPMAAASSPYVPPPPVVDDLVDSTSHAAAKAAPRDRRQDLVVAQAEPAYRSSRSVPQPEARAESPRTPATAAPSAAAPVPVAMAPEPAAAQAPATVTITATAAPQLATLPPMPPSVVSRRVAVAPVAKPASLGEVSVAAADNLDAVRKPKAALAGGVAARAPSTPLQSAADRGDVEALKTLLADPAVRVDAPDAAGRTALLHAVLAQQAAAVRLLIAAGADPTRADMAGLTPRAAAQAGANAEIAALLAMPR